MDSSTHSFPYSSRLLACLSGFDPSEKQVAKGQFSEQFGRLLDLQGAMTLSKTLGSLSALPFEVSTVPLKKITATLLSVHLEMVRSIAKSFIPRSGPSKNRLPTPAEYHSHCRFTGVYEIERSDTPNNYTAAYAPYRNFYVSRQNYLENTVHRLRSEMRRMTKGLSSEIAQLSFLDAGVETALLHRTRQLLDGIPDFMEKRFVLLLDAHWQELPAKPMAVDLERWMKPGKWLWIFTQELRALLLGELELRLLPVLGLAESIVHL
jgi:hypothetical protein